MDSRTFRIAAVVVFVLLLLKVLHDKNLPEDQVNTMLVVLECVLMAAIAGILFVTWILPGIGDKISEGMIGSGERIESSESSNAVAKLARGDYAGAITEYEKMAVAHPSDRQPVVEISRIYRDKLDDPESAIEVIHTALVSREWSAEDETFLLLRQAEIVCKDKKDFAQAREIAGTVVRKFPDSAHAANATHKLRQIDEEEYMASRNA